MKELLRIYEKKIKECPNDIDVFIKYASILAIGGSLMKARNLIVEVLEKRKEESDIVNKLLPLVVKEEQYDAAIKIFGWYKINKKTKELMDDAVLAAAFSYEKLNNQKEAIKLYQKFPTNESALMALGHAYRYSGNYEESIRAYKKVIALGKALISNAYWSLSNLKNYKFAQEDINKMLFWRKNNDQSDRRYFIDFALGYAYEKEGDYKKSFEFYEFGNKQRAGRFNKSQYIDFIGSLKENYKKVSFISDQTTSTFIPIFILGMPRSGSTLLEQILSSHSKVERLGELPYINQLIWDFEQSTIKNYPSNIEELDEKRVNRYREHYFKSCSKHLSSKSLYITDKNPNNFEHIGFIRKVFPEAIIIDTRRSFQSNAFSLYKQLFIRGQEYSYSFDDIITYYKGYESIMEYWHSLFPEKIFSVNYESIVNDFDTNVHRILAFCELEFESGCLEFYKNKQVVDTASSEQVRQPIYNNSLDYWKNYKKYLPDSIINYR
ncbi:MAG: sulfotransferase [Kangiellaceae bacterium]|nr:sulfotransferase [Kangiellaceae bacterium]